VPIGVGGSTDRVKAVLAKKVINWRFVPLIKEVYEFAVDSRKQVCVLKRLFKQIDNEFFVYGDYSANLMVPLTSDVFRGFVYPGGKPQDVSVVTNNGGTPPNLLLEGEFFVHACSEVEKTRGIIRRKTLFVNHSTGSRLYKKEGVREAEPRGRVCDVACRSMSPMPPFWLVPRIS